MRGQTPRGDRPRMGTPPVRGQARCGASSVPAAPEEEERAGSGGGGGPTCGSGMAERAAGGGGGGVADPRGVLRQGRAFLDLFWDIAKPEQEVRLAATENLLRHLRDGGKVRGGPGGMEGWMEGGRRGRVPRGARRLPKNAWFCVSGRRDAVRPQTPGGRAGSHPRGRPAGLQLGPGAGQCWGRCSPPEGAVRGSVVPQEQPSVAKYGQVFTRAAFRAVWAS